METLNLLPCPYGNEECLEEDPATQCDGCKEIWYTTPLNKKVAFILFKLDWHYLKKLCYAKYFKEYVDGFKKVLE